MSRTPSRKSWGDLTPVQRGLILVGGTVEAVLKAAALVDLARRSPEQVRGPKAAWAAAVTLINGFGVAPATYFLFGRRR